MQSNTTSFVSYVRVIALAAMLLPTSLFAQAFPTWQGTGTNWTDPANWDEAFGYGQLEWQGAGNAASWNNNSTNPLSMWRFYFNGSQAYTLGGNAVSFFDFGNTNGGILNDSSVNQTINMNINFADNGAREMFVFNRSTAGGALTFNGTITLTNGMTYLGIGGTNGSGNITFNGPIVGNKGIVIGTNSFNLNGTAMVGTRAVFNGSNSYTGTTTILRGNLAITNGNSLSTNSVILGLGSAVGLIDAGLTVNGTTTASNSFRFTDAGTNVTLTVTNGAAFTIAGALANDSGTSANTKFSKAGAGTLILANSASTYAGQIQIGDGTVVIGQSAALSTNITTATRGIDLGLNLRDVNQTNNVSLLLSNGVTLSNSIYVSANTISGTNYTRTLGIAGSGSATISNQVFLDGNLTLNIGAGNNLTTLNNPANNAFTGTGGLIKTGAGTWTASGNSSYTGKTVLAGGTTFMTFPNDTRFGAAPASFTADSLTISNGAFLITSNGVSSTLNWNANRGITIGDGGGAWQITSFVDVILGGTNQLNGSGDLLKAGSGTLTLANSNAFSGAMRFTNAFAGTFNINHQFALANSTLIRTTVSSGSSILNFGSAAGTNFTLGGLAATASGSGSDIALTNTAGNGISLTVGGNNASTTYNAVLSQGGTLVKTGTGTLTLGGANTYSGGTLVSQGALAGDTTSLQRTITNNASLIYNQSTNGTLSNVISGSGSLLKTNAGTLILSNIQTYTGNTVIAQGALTVTNGGALATNGAIQISNGAGLFVSVTTNVTLSNVISGAGNITKTSSGNLVLAASNSHTGTTTVSGGNLIAGANGAFGLGTLTINSVATSRVQLNGTTNTVIGFNSFGFTNQVIQNEGASGSAGRLIIDIASNGSTVTNTIIRDSAASGGFGTLALTKSGAGTLDLTLIQTGNGTYSGGLTVNQGTVRYSNASTTNGLGSGTITLAGGSLDFNSTGTLTNSQIVVLSTNTSTLTNAAGHVTFSGNVSGSGNLIKSGAGTTTLSGSNSYAGTLAVVGGKLDLDASSGSAAGGITGLSVSSGATLLLSQSSQVNDGATVTLSGGTITRASGVSEAFGDLTLSNASFLDFGTGDTGPLSFGTYTPSSLLTVQNFLPGNTLTFASNLTSTINNPSLFSFNGDFTSSYNGSTFTITAIPEPSTYLAAAGLAGLLTLGSLRRRFRKQR